MGQPSWLDYLTAFGAIATPILVIILTGVGWQIRSRIERRLSLEDKLREDRIEAYNQILEPFIILLMTDKAWAVEMKIRRETAGKGKMADIDKGDYAAEKLLSLDYRKQAFRLSLIGSDEVIKAYNNLMQYFYQQEEQQTASSNEVKAKEIMSLLSTFLLEVRKSMGNEATKLSNWDMLEWLLTDAKKFRS